MRFMMMNCWWIIRNDWLLLLQEDIGKVFDQLEVLSRNKCSGSDGQGGGSAVSSIRKPVAPEPPLRRLSNVSKRKHGLRVTDHVASGLRSDASAAVKVTPRSTRRTSLPSLHCDLMKLDNQPIGFHQNKLLSSFLILLPLPISEHPLMIPPQRIPKWSTKDPQRSRGQCQMDAKNLDRIANNDQKSKLKMAESQVGHLTLDPMPNGDFPFDTARGLSDPIWCRSSYPTRSASSNPKFPIYFT